MSIPSARREQVRQRAGFACEYCGVTETDAGGHLTIDHYHPQAQGGSDDWDNLVYCCHRCNEYKSDYWPQNADDPALWNPRRETAWEHFVELADGHFHAASPTGAFTVRRLRLNRSPLVAHRLRRRQAVEEQRLLTHLQAIADLLERLHAQHSSLLEEQQTLLQEQRHLLQLLLEQQLPTE